MAIVYDPGMINMWKPEGIGADPPSTSQRHTVFKIQGGEETLVIPVYTNTKVTEVKYFMAMMLGVDIGRLKFTHRQGTMIRQNLDCEEVARQVTVHGIKSFSREQKEWPYPLVIIGAGHLGLKTGLTWLMEKPQYTNWVLFDRRPEVGGTSWWQQANKTSRLQTEVAVYHLQFHETQGWPPDASENPWPSRDQLILNFTTVCKEWGMYPYFRMETDVVKMNIIGKDYWEQYYELSIQNKHGEESIFQTSGMCFYPGNLTNPKRVIYKGEELFDGDIVYGISCEYDYSRCTNNNVSIIGSGAFAVENVRTCVEYAVKKIFMVCRRKTLAMPRIVSWLCNQSMQFISAALTMEAMSPMYGLIGCDHWSYYAVYANEARTTVTLRQKSRFGIGDVYFLAMYYEMVEHIVDDVKRLSQNKIHLMNGRTLDDISSILKLLGFNGEFNNDRLFKLKELYGFWANRDFRRYIVAEPLGVDANNFGGTSFSPGAISWSEQQVHLFHYPKDWVPVMESGAMPVHVADESIDRPAYVVEARHGALVGVSIGSLIRGIGDRGAVTGPLANLRSWQIHPIDKFIECARKEWEMWIRQIESHGYTKPAPPYPYTIEMVNGYLEKEKDSYREMEARMMRQMGAQQ
mmetsp:Transcript_17374/g.50815  ORF Transcript_17374/g.50815 Transcript_17374/m.50815 type:complete len:631 (-) Transcript_17374:57-1949(-)|eukprot:CAMPEP_0168409300 /NCGR_PEP_ID=MMETSP0228-20121227/27112_1 /TAXON_ID=133427 /ORGANISM="Protoceratium reticulatum, Strain CCCM 535 (=CCMP 1889)" /LENGTH=630 /DNA_ID=CAMNT_0008423007 /DNA_START=46 /DNA_END=1938 /DNA_ORIENTATION=-